MERKSASNRSKSPDFSLLETHNLMATEKMLFTQDLDDTQLVEPTQDTSKSHGVSQIGGITGHSDNSSDQCYKGVAIKDRNLNNRLECTEDLPKMEEVLPTQASVLTCEENDLTPEIPGIDRTASECTRAGSKEKVEIVGGTIPLSQSSGSSENPESTPSGSQPSSSLSSSDSSQQTNRSTPAEPKTASVADSGVNLDVTQDLFLSEDAALGETRIASQKNNSPLSLKSPLADIRHRAQIRDKKEADVKERLFRANLKSPGVENVDAVKPRQRRSSGGNMFKQRVLNKLADASPPLNSQEVNLRVSGSNSDPGAASQDEMEGFPALKTPETPKKQVNLAIPEAEECLCRDRPTVEMLKNLLVTSTSLVDCKILADRKSGEVISLQITHVENLNTKAKQIEEPTMFGISPVNTETGALKGHCCAANKDELWKAAMVGCFHEALKTTLTSSFQKATHFNSANERESVERRDAFVMPVPELVPVPIPEMSSRKRKLSSSASPPCKSGGAVAVDIQSTKPSTSSSPFKRPRVRRLSAGREKIGTPKKRNISPPHPNPLPPPSSSEFNVANSLPRGAKVFGQWIDKKYYPGIVLKQNGTDQHLVKFHDGKEKELPSNKVCLVNTFEINQPVLALSAGFYKKGVVAEVKAFDYKEDKYIIKLDQDGSLLELSHDELSLTEQMVQNYRAKHSCPDAIRREKALAIDLGNVVHGKRTRSALIPSPVPGPSGSKARLTLYESSSCEEIEAADCCLKITGIEAEVNNIDPLAGKGPKKSKGRKKLSMPDEERLLNEYGPIPDEGFELFKGLSFILTCAMKHDHENPKERQRNGSPPKDNSDADVDSLSENDCFCGPFNKIKKTMSKSRLSEQLIAGGGKILTTLDDLDAESELENVFVIANRPCLTAVYIHCLALGIKGVLFDAVIHCCKKEIQFKDYIDQSKLYLDAGYSIKEGRLIPWNEFKDKASKPFNNVNIYVYSRDKAFIKYWERILTCAGATLITLQSMVEYCTVIVAEPPVSDILRKRAADSSIPIVSTDWIVQSLIHKEALPVHWHADFEVGCDDSD